MNKQGIMIEWINKRNNKAINSKSVNSIIIKVLGLNSNTLKPFQPDSSSIEIHKLNYLAFIPSR